MACSLRMTRSAAEDEVDGLAERTATDLGRGFIKMLHLKGRHAADRWLSQDPDQMMPRSLSQPPRDEFGEQLFEMRTPLAETMSESVSPTLMSYVRRRVQTGAYMASATVRPSPKRNGPPEAVRHDCQIVSIRSTSAWTASHMGKPG